MIDIEKLKEGDEISYKDLTFRDMVVLKEFFDLILDGDKKKVQLRTIQT